MTAILTFLATLSSLSAGAAPLRLEALTQQKGDPDGCICAFGDKSGTPEKNYIMNGGALNLPIIVQVDGKRHRLECITVNKNEVEWPETKVGKIFSRVYRDSSLEVTLRYKVVSVCPKSQPECESIRYNVDAFLKSKDREGKHLGLTGACAC